MLRDATSRSIDLGSAPWTVSWGPHVCSALGLSFLMLSHCAKRPSVRLDCECAATTPCSCECCGASPAIRLGRRTEQRRTRPVPLPRATRAEPKKNLFPSLAVLPPTYIHARRGHGATPTGALSPSAAAKTWIQRSAACGRQRRHGVACQHSSRALPPPYATLHSVRLSLTPLRPPPEQQQALPLSPRQPGSHESGTATPGAWRR